MIMTFVYLFCFYLFILVFYWNLIALQCYISFCCTTTSISYLDTYIPALLDLAPCTLHLSSLGHHRIQPVLHRGFPLASYFTHGSVYSMYIHWLFRIGNTVCEVTKKRGWCGRELKQRGNYQDAESNAAEKFENVKPEICTLDLAT